MGYARRTSDERVSWIPFFETQREKTAGACEDGSTLQQAVVLFDTNV